VGESRLLIVTDGVLEMPTESGRELGARKLRKLLAAHEGGSASLSRTALLEALLAERGSQEPDDHLTLPVIGQQ
jgi:serine phosphatase RsbU (regulator of sigma subunit)